jgi:hypothetical protein
MRHADGPPGPAAYEETTSRNETPPRGTTRFISGAVVSDSPAVLLSRILRSPNVVTVLNHPPLWVDRAELAATIAAIHKAAQRFGTASAALEREDATVVSAVTPQLGPEWTVRRAADFLGLSQRRTQELAAQLGGRKVGRQWLLDELAVREYGKRRHRAA